MIDLYFWPTPNGKKITILLEEAGIAYNIKPINIGRGDQLTPDFLKISPNGRMPAIVDHEPKAAARRSPFSNPARSWNTWPRRAASSGRRNRIRNTKSCNGSIGRWPTRGRRWVSRGTFDAPPGIQKTATRLMRCCASTTKSIESTECMNLGLHQKRYLAAGQYTIADMICYPWASNLEGPKYRSRRISQRQALA